jgi:hypothetical protein
MRKEKVTVMRVTVNTTMMDNQEDLTKMRVSSQARKKIS